MSTIQQEKPTPEGYIEVVPFAGAVVVRHGDQILASSTRAQVLREQRHADRYYLPREDIRLDLLAPVDQSSYCPWKGTASDYWSIAGDANADPIAWSYPEPYESVAAIDGLIAFYDEKLTVDLTAN